MMNPLHNAGSIAKNLWRCDSQYDRDERPQLISQLNADELTQLHRYVASWLAPIENELRYRERRVAEMMPPELE